ncbi:hypothetical protein SmJEL517_g05515 [Synchytrium microbalum]|uniref:ABC transporter domain-containing protein n=1 Tax=Synchytrium microbalum TaxID=1806994 RepID=A0A507BV51_9FUNG|nr:uncharacterized protein SmJEL517_g05515 [Synchytrium microbalum]TPX31061.1 hypothetical protein SmJEL517_g05515 [Synchytrium microbalum]
MADSICRAQSHRSSAATIARPLGSALEFRDIKYRITSNGKTRRILNASAFGINSSGFVCLLGGSGSGKTTLLNILANRIYTGRITGEIRVDGKERSALFYSEIGFVESDDLMYEQLTVRETLMYAAKLKLPQTMTYNEKRSRVDSVISRLGLLECADSIIGGNLFRSISTGERRRVAIGVELLSHPKLLFLDEPTSGLDAFWAQEVVGIVKRDSLRTNTTTIMCLHQPRKEILEMFNLIYIMSNSGSLTFCGSLSEAYTYFASIGHPIPATRNPADYLVELSSIRPESIEESGTSARRVKLLIESWKVQEPSLFPPFHSRTLKLETHNKPIYTIQTFLKRVTTLLHRELVMFGRDRRATFMTLFITLVSSILLGLVYIKLLLDQNSLNSRLGLLFGISGSRFLMPAFYIAQILPDLKPLIARERVKNFFNIYEYYVAKFLVSAIIPMSQCLMMTFTIYYMVGLQPDRFIGFLIMNILASLSGCAFGFFVSVLATDSTQAQFITAFIAAFSNQFTGFLILVSEMPRALFWLHYITPSAYIMSALSTNELNGLNFSCNADATNCFQTGEQVVSSYGFGEIDFWANAAIVAGIFGTAFFEMAALMLALKTSTKARPVITNRKPATQTDTTTFIPLMQMNKGIDTYRHSTVSTLFSMVSPISPILTLVSPLVSPYSPYKKDDDLTYEEVFYNSAYDEGPSCFRISSRSSEFVPQRSLRLEWRDVKYKVSAGTTRQILRGVSGEIKPGEFVAIIGGSGAGKTTLLNVLASRITAGVTTGDIRINGRARNPRTWSSQIGFVQAEDCVFESLTVRQTLTYTALLKLSDSMTYKEKLERVESVIKRLGLSLCANQRLGGLNSRGVSNGEKKRCAIGQELLSHPSILFLDEPTSKLDASHAFQVVEIMAKDCKKTRSSVVMTIHQPRQEILNMFDRIIFMSNGMTTFSGTLEEAYMHFLSIGYPLPINENPADYIVDMSTLHMANAELHADSMKHIAALTEGWRKQEAFIYPPFRYKVLPPENDSASMIQPFAWKNYLKRAGILLHRELRLFFIDTPYLITIVAHVALLCFLYGWLLFKMPLTQAGIRSRIGLLYNIALERFAAGTVNVVRTTIETRPVILRERLNNVYTFQEFYPARLFVSLLGPTLQGAVLFGIIYVLTGLNASAYKIAIFYIIGTLGVICGNGVGTIVAAFADPSVVGTFIAMISFVASLFSGVLITQSAMPGFISWIPFINPLFYIINTWSQNEFDGKLIMGLEFSCPPVGSCLATGQQVIKFYGYDGSSLIGSLAALVVFAVFSNVVGAYLCARATSLRVKLPEPEQEKEE